MRRMIQIGVMAALLIGCGAPAGPAAPTAENTRKPVQMVIEVASPTATDAPTFTPIPATSTVAATFTLAPSATSTATLTPTLKATSTIAATATKVVATVTRLITQAPTRTQVPTAIPTIFLAPTETLAPIAIQPTNPPAQVCCKYCSAGKACGDSCITKEKTCNKGPGCACNK